MRLTKLGAALFVVAALGLGAILASSALAAAVTEDVKWYTGASPGTELSGSANVTSRELSPTIVLETHWGGFALKLSGAGISCVECRVKNEGGTAVGTGKLRFTGVTVVEPSTCSVAATLTTNALKLNADYMLGSVDYVKLEPATGPENGWLTLSIGGAMCPIKTAVIPKGTVFMRSQNATGTQAKEQEVHSSAAINTEAGGTFHIAEESASLTGDAMFELESGAPFGTH